MDSGLRGQVALVTGATSGIGYATAELLAKSGCDLILVGRRESRLVEIAAKFKSDYRCEVQALALDLRDRASVEGAFARIEKTLAKLSIVVNSAGLALGTEPMPTAKVDDWESMIDTNIKGLLFVTRLCLPHLQKNNRGHIVNLGSVAGRWTYPGGGVYCATKFAVRALTEGLRLDLLGTAIRVTNIEPGMVETEFSEVRNAGDKAKAKKVYEGMTPLTAHDIAESIVWCLARPARVNIQELVIYPTAQAGVGPYVHRTT